MAIVRSLAIGKATGSMGGITYRTISGDTIASQKRGKSSTKLSYLQSINIVSWANAVNIWQAFEGNDRPSFENRLPRVSDFNEFIAASRRVPVYLTRSVAQQGGAVVAPYQVTRGSLPSLDNSVAGTGGEIGTNIELGELTIDENTTLGQFSRAIIENNEGWVNHDALILFVLRQSTNSVTGVPYVTVDEYKITLDVSDNDTLLSEFDPDGVAFVKTPGSTKLGMGMTVNGGAVYIHSRLTTDGTQVSTQSIIATNTILPNYQSVSVRDEAIASYGGNLSRLYLTPDTSMAIGGI